VEPARQPDDRTHGGRLRVGRVNLTLAAVLLLALVARLPGLGDRPLWYDEAFAVLFSAKGPGAMIVGTLTTEGRVAADVHPLLYYTALWGWDQAFGSSPVASRGLSVLVDLAVVALGFFLARELFGMREAIAGGVLLALAPFQVHYGQEARMYALLAAFLIGATLVYVRALERGGLWRWVVLGVLGAAAQYTHNLAVLYLVPLGLTSLILRRRKAIWGTAIAGPVAVALLTPWLVHLPSQLARVSQAYWIAPPGPADLVRTLLVFVAGLPVPDSLLPVVLILAVLVIAVVLWLTLQAWKRGDPGSRRAAWLAYLAFAPVILMFVASMWSPIYLDRAMLPSGVAFILWLGWALAAQRGAPVFTWTGRPALALAFAVGLFGFYTYSGFPYAPYPNLDEFLRQHRAPGDVIVHSNKLSAIPAIYYAPDLEQRYLADPPGSGSDTLAPATQRVLGLMAQSDIAAASQGASGVWFIVFPREIEEYRALGTGDHPALAWLEARFRTADVSDWGDLRVYHFAR
jgi:4-amino-4-deoxy-L-arabinose transferase-like glycosyltransferase